VGSQTLESNSGNWNSAVGAGTLFFNTTGSNNTAVGDAALSDNTTASENTAIGAFALFSNTTGGTPSGSGRGEVGPNTAVGALALASNTTGGANTAVGYQALGSIQNSGISTAVGFEALANSTSAENEAFGYKALTNNTAGIDNTAIGNAALYNNTSGFDNVALGDSAGLNQTTGSENVYIGVGMAGVAGESNACYIGSIFGQTAVSGVPVLVSSNNKLGTLTSSKRFKEDIKPMDNASEVILALRPVTFHYKNEIDSQGVPQFGLVAEDVEKVNPALVVRDKEGKPYTVRYDQVNAMLLNEFLKEHGKVQEQEVTIMQLQKEMRTVVECLKEQDSRIQKVSDQIELGKPTPRIAASEP
jgi:hypothetical protein